MNVNSRPPQGVFPAEGLYRYAISTDEFRPPKKGELYLSGAVVTAHLAPNDFTQPYWIARPVELTRCPQCSGSGKVVKRG